MKFDVEEFTVKAGSTVKIVMKIILHWTSWANATQCSNL